MGQVPAPKGRPLLVWAICLFYFIAIPVTLLGAAWLLLLAGAPVDARQAFLARVSLTALGLSVIVSLFNLVSAVFLFRLKRVAYTLFLISFGWVAGSSIFRLGQQGARGLPASVAAVALSGGVLLYVRSLRDDGTLS